jgi:hypothetical protein
MNLQSFGFLNANKNTLVSNNYQKCLEMNHKTAKVKQLGINNLSSAFLLLAFGYGLAIIAFIGEVVLKTQNIYHIRVRSIR